MNKDNKSKIQIASRSIYKDGWFLGLCTLTLVFVLFNITWALINIKQTQIQIPIRFSSLTNFDQLGNWYQLYEIPIIMVMITLANFALANLLHHRNRLISIFLMMAGLMSAVLATAILIGFTVINYGTN
ncbi:hypothetical protein EXS53_02120 [Patescibacteria group bacterium]|jgi:uncharacterized BrkB/YihY/UPF0761 family membrane protein|nr:hypothetical protein [Patescibacteria group bacterium]